MVKNFVAVDNCLLMLTCSLLELKKYFFLDIV